MIKIGDKILANYTKVSDEQLGDSNEKVPTEAVVKNYMTERIDIVNAQVNTKQDILVSGENIKTVNGLDILGSGNIDTSEVFIAEYGVTNFQDILNAYNEGKTLVCVFNRPSYINVYVCTTFEYTPPHTFDFYIPMGPVNYRVVCQSGDSWNYYEDNLETTSNKVTSISSSSTDTKYPSAKCVYNNLNNKQDKITIKYDI